ncbi:B3 domain-containing protein [Hordeum vulgare]|nr:B3 domain-containing protein [Hordeum vulgare]
MGDSPPPSMRNSLSSMGDSLLSPDDDCTEVPVQAGDDSMEVPVQSRVCRDRQRVIIDAAIVEGIKKRRKMGRGRRRGLRSATPSEMPDLEGIEFFTIILDKSSSRQLLPHNFVKMLDGHRPQNMKLRQAGNGLCRLWDVEVVYDTDGSMYLDRGWKQFVRGYDLRHGYFHVFRYDGNYVFTVKVFDMTMCRMRYQDNDDASNGSRSSDSGYNNRCYSKSSSDSGYSNNISKDEEEQSGEEEEQSRDD